MPIAETVVTPGVVTDASPLSFRAIFAGWFIATGVAALLYLAGMALGFSSFDAWDAADSAKSIGIGTGVWMVLTWVAALFLGGMFASWFDGRNDDTTGAVHGVTVWGMSLVATALWVSLGLSQAVGSYTAAKSDHMPQPDTHSRAHAAGPASVMVLDAHIARLVAPAGRADRVASAPVTAALLAGHDDTAAALLAAESGTTQAEAAGTLAGLAPEIQTARRDAKAASDKAAHYAAMTLWIAFISALLALVAATLGGWLGARQVHRVYHLRRYPDRRII
jgi:hypothetical protein